MSQPQQPTVPAQAQDRSQPYCSVSGIHTNSQHSPISSSRFLPPRVARSNGSSPLNLHFAVSQPFLHSPSHGQTASPATPSMAQSYNPQQWDQQRFGFQRVMPSSSGTRNATGMEAALPSPPPPYSPATPGEGSSRVRPSPMLEQHGFTASPSSIQPTHFTLAPAASTSPSFPPPPNSQPLRMRERSASGIRLLNTIQTITGRGKQPVLDTQPHWAYSPGYGKPPAARRAASTGHIGQSSSSVTPTTMRNERFDPAQWQSGMPLPGPPPGPPPPGTRSQSLTRYAASSSSSTSSPMMPSMSRPARHAALAPSLGTVPPTPADWIDADNEPTNSVDNVSAFEPVYPPLRIDTGAPREHSLTRRPATREPSAQGLRERRSRSKATQDGSRGDTDLLDIETQLSPETVASTVLGAISQRREHKRRESGMVELSHGGRPSRPTTVMTPPYTPAANRTLSGPQSASSDKAKVIDAMTTRLLHSSLDSFYIGSMERYHRLIEQEAAATSDEERLELFADFLVHESRMRRDRYPDAYTSMAGQIVDLTRDMWRSYSRAAKRVATPNTARSADHPTSDRMSPGRPDELTPATDDCSLGDDGPDRSRQWGGAFQPCLSPIPSMAVSTVPEEASSRGRAPSRWWEQSQASGSIGKPERIEKSHRETKYMGITAAMLQSSPQQSPELVRQAPTPNTGTFLLGPDEYPPEKLGLHDPANLDTPMALPGQIGRVPTPNTPAAVDISRLITLPPPYPRHHPAINNNHPQLGDLRNDYRKLNVADELQRIKDAHLDQDWTLKSSQQDAAKQRRSKMRSSMQDKLNEGSLTFAEAAKVEAAFDVDEIDRGRKDARARFDRFEAAVSHPLNTLVSERLALAEKCITSLCSDLELHDRAVRPNRAQEEGDEHPERLEKLTLLKWLFEAREVLHRDMFDLHAQRAERYGEVVLCPYRLAKQQNKLDEAEAFFRKDSHDRLTTFRKDALQRHEDFLRIVETNVTRGLEDQLSAFWDIAPGLRDLIQQVPSIVGEDMEEHVEVLNHFHIQIPPHEYEENGAYKEYPLQYLYSLLCHAERSAYQFIESQINLLCMQHAVRENTTEASLKALQLDRTGDSTASPTTDLSGEMEQAKDAEGRRLTADLQDKVGEVERQWRQALGDRFTTVKTGVRKWLEECGGWEEGLES